MEHRVLHGPTFAILEIDLQDSEIVVAQPNSMLAMTPGIELRAMMGRGGSKSGWFSGVQGVLGGENLFTAEFRAKRDGQQLSIAPEAHGDILELPLRDSGGYFLTRGSYLANLGPCDLEIKYGGVKGLMAKTGIFLLKVSGEGIVFCQTFGAIVERTLSEGESFVVDNRYMVAFSQSVRFELVKATRTLKDSIMSGEGLVNRYTGPGKIFYQTRAKPSVGFLGRLLDLST
jgi:uncharacterized protein (TIGR00266 family)